jgi:Fe-S cluster assembly protein SufD
MNIIFLSATDLKKNPALEPQKDTLYFLTEGTGENALSLNLSTPGIRAFLVGLFRTNNETNFVIHQNHSAPHTVSHVLLKSTLEQNAKFSYQGNLHIEKDAVGTVASQEARGLLLGDGAQFKAIPSLEILPKDVSCTHKASAAPVNENSLFALETRGLSKEEAQKLLENAFLNSAFETLSAWGLTEKEISRIQEQYQQYAY